MRMSKSSAMKCMALMTTMTTDDDDDDDDDDDIQLNELQDDNTMTCHNLSNRKSIKK